MLISSTGISQASNIRRNASVPNFTNAGTIELQGDFFKVKKQKSGDKNIFDKYRELKELNFSPVNIAKIALLSDNEYKMILDIIKQDYNRLSGLREEKTKAEFSKSKDKFAELTDTTYSLQYNNGYGYYAKSLLESKDKKTIRVSRTLNSHDGRQESTMIDASKLNPNYNVRNGYLEVRDYNDEYKLYGTRNVSIEDNNGKQLLKYTFGKKNTRNSNVSRFRVNGKEYNVHIKDNLDVIITSGKKGRKIQFEDRLDDSMLNKKDLFKRALKYMPPQLLFALDENFDTIKSVSGNGGYKGRTLGINTYTTKSAVKTMVDNTIEFLSYKRKLVDDKDLINTYETELNEFKNWITTEEAYNSTIKRPELYIDNSDDIEQQLLNIIKSICELLWFDDYDDNKSTDEEKRVLLNHFPKTVSYIVTKFELNDI